MLEAPVALARKVTVVTAGSVIVGALALSPEGLVIARLETWGPIAAPVELTVAVWVSAGCAAPATDHVREAVMRFRSSGWMSLEPVEPESEHHHTLAEWLP